MVAVATGDGDHRITGRIATFGQLPRVTRRRSLNDIDRPAFGTNPAHDGIRQSATATTGRGIDDQKHRLGSAGCHRTVTTDSRPRNGSHTQFPASRAITHDRFSAD